MTKTSVSTIGFQATVYNWDLPSKKLKCCSLHCHVKFKFNVSCNLNVYVPCVQSVLNTWYCWVNKLSNKSINQPTNQSTHNSINQSAKLTIFQRTRNIKYFMLGSDTKTQNKTTLRNIPLKKLILFIWPIQIPQL